MRINLLYKFICFNLALLFLNCWPSYQFQIILRRLDGNRLNVHVQCTSIWKCRFNGVNLTSSDANTSSSLVMTPHMLLPLTELWSIQSTTPVHFLAADQSTLSSLARVLLLRTKQRWSSSSKKIRHNIWSVTDEEHSFSYQWIEK